MNSSKKCSKVAILFFGYKMKFRHEYLVQKLGNNICSQKEALLGGWMDGWKIRITTAYGDYQFIHQMPNNMSTAATHKLFKQQDAAVTPNTVYKALHKV